MLFGQKRNPKPEATLKRNSSFLIYNLTFCCCLFKNTKLLAKIRTKNKRYATNNLKYFKITEITDILSELIKKTDKIISLFV